jgi:hypothetical protein
MYPPLLFPFSSCPSWDADTYLGLRDAGERPEEDELQDDTCRGPDMAKSYQNGGQLHQGVSIDGERDLAVAQGLAQGVERHALGLVLGHVLLQSVDGPVIVKDKSDQENVGTAVPTVARHFPLLVFLFGLMLFRKRFRLFLFRYRFYLRKEITRIYRRVKKITQPFHTVFGLWSIKFGF